MLELLAELLTRLVKARQTAEVIWNSRGGDEVSSELSELRDDLDALIHMLRTSNK